MLDFVVCCCCYSKAIHIWTLASTLFAQVLNVSTHYTIVEFSSYERFYNSENLDFNITYMVNLKKKKIDPIKIFSCNR